MEFNGAVLVDNIKIKNACENYKRLDKEWIKLAQGIIDTLVDEFKELSWWTKFWYDDSNLYGLYKYQYVLQERYGQTIESKWSEKDEDLFLNSGFITKEQYKYFEKYNSSQDHYHTLMQLVEAGTPVYLNVGQATFVNKFYKGE